MTNEEVEQRRQVQINAVRLFCGDSSDAYADGRIDALCRHFEDTGQSWIANAIRYGGIEVEAEEDGAMVDPQTYWDYPPGPFYAINKPVENSSDKSFSQWLTGMSS